MSIFTHIVLDTNGLEHAREFYDRVLAPLGSKRIIDRGNASMWGKDHPSLTVGTPINGEPATCSNGLTIGLVAPSDSAVSEFHATPLANGGSSEGKPGRRDFLPNGCMAYMRDPDGNKTCAIYTEARPAD